MTNVHNELRIVRVANGFAVEMPRPLSRPYPDLHPEGAGDFFADGMKKAMPYFKEMIRLRDTDDTLDRLQHPEKYIEEPEPVTKPELPDEPIGIDPYTHVFPTWGGVLEFLSNLVL